MTENVTHLFSEAEATDTVVDGPEPDEAPYHSILKVWKSMLDPEQQSRDVPPTPDWCAVLVARWPFLRFSDCGAVQAHYFQIFDSVHAVLSQVEADNPEAFEVDTREADVEENKEIYVFLLAEFQKALLAVQAEWSYDDPEAGAKMAAMGEAQQQILGRDGLASYLGVIGLPFSQEEQDALNEELAAFRKEIEGR